MFDPSRREGHNTLVETHFLPAGYLLRRSPPFQGSAAETLPETPVTTAADPPAKPRAAPTPAAIAGAARPPAIIM